MSTHSIKGPTKSAYLQLVAAERGPEVNLLPAITLSFDQATVDAAERTIGTALDAKLLLLFSGTDVFGMYDLELEQLSTHREEADNAGVPTTLIPLGRDGNEWVCIKRDAPAKEIIVYDDGDESRVAMSIAAWIDQVVHRHLRGSGGSPEQRRAVSAWAKKTPLDVHIEAKKVASSLYRVKHAKFGEGVVRREDPAGDDTKLEIDFADHGVRILMSRFVTRIS